MRTLDAFLNDQRIGTLSEGNDLWQFEYDVRWAEGSESFDLSPRLTRSQLLHADSGSDRPVQWYFDNLLPEDDQRTTVAKEAQINRDDAFALLEYLGAESAGSLVLSPTGAGAPARGLTRLSDPELSTRIQSFPRRSLSSDSPKRMSAA